MKYIANGLYLGDQGDAIGAALHGHFVEWIFYLGQELPKELAFDSKVPVVHFPLLDGKVDATKIKFGLRVFTKTVRKGDSVLVACRVGISRSPTFCALYLAYKKGLPFERGLCEMQRLVPQFQPNQDLLDSMREVIP